MVSKTRATRIGERIREDLAEILIYKMQDPRLSGITITEVKIDNELTYADIYYSAVEGSERSVEIQAGFEHAQGFLRTELAQKVELRHFPRLRFHWDPSFERAERIDRLIAEIRRENKQTTENDGE